VNLTDYHRGVEALLGDYVEQCLECLKKPESPVTITDAFCEQFKLKYHWRQVRAEGFGGFNKVPYIRISLARFYFEEVLNGRNQFHEYKRLRKEPDIGSFEADGETCLMALVAHEIAHAAQWTIKVKRRERKPYRYLVDPKDIPLDTLDKPHGKGWQRIYRYLRQRLVNKKPDYKEI
jgi:hypothetical protein